MRQNVRDILDTIDEFLLNGSEDEAMDLWDILSALRGPDDAEEDKDLTARIRGAAFPQMASCAMPESGDMRFTTRCGLRISTEMPTCPAYKRGLRSTHFRTHIRRAVNATRKEATV